MLTTSTAAEIGKQSCYTQFISGLLLKWLIFRFIEGSGKIAFSLALTVTVKIHYLHSLAGMTFEAIWKCIVFHFSINVA